MNKVFLAVIGFVVIVGGITANSALFTVHQTEQALVLQFGNPVKVVKEPGLHFKTPFVQDVTLYDNRILNLDPPPQEIILQDQKRVNVDSFVRYRIVDPLEYRKKAFTDANFVQVFGSQLTSAVRAEIGKILLGDMLTAKRATSMDNITVRMKSQGPKFGVEVIDVRIGRIDLPEVTSQSVYSRMKSDRIATAAELRAKGEEQKLRIQSEAEKDRTIIIAAAKKDSEILRGQGDGKKTTILNDAYGQDAEFFDFYRSMDALGIAVGNDTTLVLSPDSDLFQFFGAVPKVKN
ncbi:MAG: protease modulator HflC [Rhodospirillales bacterium]|jgi:membrane protease subunit HflC